MAIIAADEKVFMVSNSTNTTYSGSAALKAMNQWYTMQDVIDTVGVIGGVPPLDVVTSVGNTITSGDYTLSLGANLLSVVYDTTSPFVINSTTNISSAGADFIYNGPSYVGTSSMGFIGLAVNDSAPGASKTMYARAAGITVINVATSEQGLFDSKGIQLTKSGNVLSIRTPDSLTANFTIKFPNAAGTVALASDIPSFIRNTTTSALSLATLNATYPQAIVGSSIYCSSIVGGGLVYTKIANSTWVSSSITLVV
jgi:hypothetical protein